MPTDSSSLLLVVVAAVVFAVIQSVLLLSLSYFMGRLRPAAAMYVRVRVYPTRVELLRLGPPSAEWYIWQANFVLVAWVTIPLETFIYSRILAECAPYTQFKKKPCKSERERERGEQYSFAAKRTTKTMGKHDNDNDNMSWTCPQHVYL